MHYRSIKPALIACLLAGFLAGCSVSEKQEVQTLFGYSMGTSYSIKLVSSLSEARRLQLGIDGVLSDINSRMSTYLPNSDLSTFAEAPLNSPVKVDEKTVYVVQKALSIAAKTEGYFDPTIAPIVDLWGFGPTARNAEQPDTQVLAEILQSQVGYQAVSVVDSKTLKKEANRSLDLSAIAKGYAVDLVANYIQQQGFTNFLVEVGGEMRFSGQKPSGKAWRIAVEKPEVGVREAFRILDVTDGAVATSGDYRNYFEIEGVRYSHTIDPHTGYPVEHDLASVTVVAEECLIADAYATAFMAMGRDKSLAFAEQHDLAVLLIFKAGSEFLSVQSSAFTRKFGEASLPS